MQLTNRNPVLVVVFTIISCGIYAIYWNYKTIKETNEALGREEIPMWMFIISIFVGVLWYIVWYKLDDVVLPELCQAKGIAYGDKKFMMWLLLAILAGVGLFVAMYQIQDTMNKLGEAA